MNPGELGDLIGALSHVRKNKMKILYLPEVFVKDLGHRYKVSYVSGVFFLIVNEWLFFFPYKRIMLESVETQHGIH